MPLATVYTRAQCGLDAPEVTCEVHLSGGLPGLSIVGLAETSVKESRERVRAAIRHSGYEMPNGKITVNLIRYWVCRTRLNILVDSGNC